MSVVFWQFDEHDKPATVTEPYEKAFTAANLKKEQEFYDRELTFRVRLQVGKSEKTTTLTLGPKDNAASKFKALMEDKPEVLAVEWRHRHYLKDDEYIPHGEDIEAFLKREIAKGTPGMDVMKLAAKLAKVIDAKGLGVQADDLREFDGVGDAKATLVLAALARIS